MKKIITTLAIALAATLNSTAQETTMQKVNVEGETYLKVTEHQQTEYGTMDKVYYLATGRCGVFMERVSEDSYFDFVPMMERHERFMANKYIKEDEKKKIDHLYTVLIWLDRKAKEANKAVRRDPSKDTGNKYQQAVKKVQDEESKLKRRMTLLEEEAYQ